jgi:hypothetical protein
MDRSLDEGTTSRLTTGVGDNANVRVYNGGDTESLSVVVITEKIIRAFQVVRVNWTRRGRGETKRGGVIREEIHLWRDVICRIFW